MVRIIYYRTCNVYNKRVICKFIIIPTITNVVYNHNGQNYFEQLTTYNSMSSHLRRVLLAKCVIDSRNKNCTSRRKQFCKQVECKPHFTKKRMTNDLINRLAYDSLHHPAVNYFRTLPTIFL